MAAGGAQAADEHSVALSALHAINPGVGRHQWLRYALAAKAAGLSLDEFREWSEQADNYSSSRDVDGAWRDEPQSIGPATLYWIAEHEYGWQRPRRSNGNGNGHHASPSTAAAIWSMCQPAQSDHPYLVRKQGLPDGLRIYPLSAAPYEIARADVRGWLVVPAMDGADIATLQFIAPGGRKLNLPRHDVRGSFAVGEPDGGPVYVVEGIGHAWACWRATGHQAVCCFGAGNMARVVESLKGRAVVIVADRGKERDAEQMAGKIGADWIGMPADKPANYDANDYLIEYGAEALALLLERVRIDPQMENGRQESDVPLRLLTLGELSAQMANVGWTIKGIIPARALGMLFGAADTFKSFIAIDLALHIAHGLPWLGRKTRAGPVVLVVAEGGAGVWRRIQAWHQRHGLNWRTAPVYVLPQPIDLRTDASMLRTAITALGIEPVLIVVDTMSQTFGDGDEDKSKDVGPYLAELGLQLRLALDSTVLVIHHTGHNAHERPRGSSALKANVDFLFGCFRDEQQMLATLECHKQKDGDKFEPLSFSLRVEELGRDEDNDAITSLVAEFLDSQDALIGAMSNEAKRGNGGRNHLLMELLQNGMKEKELRHAFYDQLSEMDSDARRQAYFRARKWAIQSNIMEIAQGVIVMLDRGTRA